jgi:acyl-CoA synthetase (AMP-forming)/AMP-acid ligase II
MNIAEAILSRGADVASAVLYKDMVLSYGELREGVARVAGDLLARGHAKGDRIGICSENSPFSVVAYLGIIRAGLVAVPLPAELTEDGFGKIASNAGFQEAFVSKRFFNRVRPWAQRAGVALLPEAALNDGRSTFNAHQFPSVEPVRDLAALMFTSGSTGIPKGVMLTHRNIECNTRDIISYMGLGPGDRAMVVLPFHYCFGLSLLHTHLMAGASLVLNNDFKLYPEVVLREMQRKDCTGLAGVPSTYQILLRKSRFRQMEFPRLRWLQQAGGKLPNPQIQEIRSAFPQVRYFLMYGQTEATARLSYLPPERLADKLGSIGKGLPSARLQVLKPDGTPVTPGSNEVGEIVAFGDNIALGYWKDPGETAKYFRDGRLHTGDLARVDAEGFIFIVDRERDMIKSGGNRVSAREVEEVIAEIGDVVEAAVLGMPHELLGEAIKAFVVLAPDSTTTARAVADHCRKRLPSFKVPDEVIFLNNMPHNSAGKILKPKLKEMLAQPFSLASRPQDFGSVALSQE